ncbi:hypothetical protein Snas_5237 [Stackebrandtia nassauensis DSM 44728]|uniref:Uncharacterized protein n=2 Tax=Stackebrandtia TaxID=283810 RepID=D3QBY2_STANL|nr:hypothetical protein Snas_5237 [Stackebrandtia nassauensis DSM 44728]
MDAEPKDPDEFKTFIASLGLVPPPHSRGNVHVEWLPDEDPNEVVGIFAWGVPTPEDH